MICKEHGYYKESYCEKCYQERKFDNHLRSLEIERLEQELRESKDLTPERKV